MKINAVSTMSYKTQTQPNFKGLTVKMSDNFNRALKEFNGDEKLKAEISKSANSFIKTVKKFFSTKGLKNKKISAEFDFGMKAGYFPDLIINSRINNKTVKTVLNLDSDYRADFSQEKLGYLAKQFYKPAPKWDYKNVMFFKQKDNVDFNLKEVARNVAENIRKALISNNK